MLTENKTIELKREYVDDIKNTIIAFADCDGGTLFINRKVSETKPKLATSYTKKEERSNAVVELCRKNGYVIRKDIEAELKISQATSILLLRELTEEGLLEKKGTAKNLRYYLRES